jgi:hypothetical protein
MSGLSRTSLNIEAWLRNTDRRIGHLERRGPGPIPTVSPTIGGGLVTHLSQAPATFTTGTIGIQELPFTTVGGRAYTITFSGVSATTGGGAAYFEVRLINPTQANDEAATPDFGNTTSLFQSRATGTSVTFPYRETLLRCYSDGLDYAGELQIGVPKLLLAYSTPDSITTTGTIYVKVTDIGPYAEPAGVVNTAVGP